MTKTFNEISKTTCTINTVYYYLTTSRWRPHAKVERRGRWRSGRPFAYSCSSRITMKSRPTLRRFTDDISRHAGGAGGLGCGKADPLSSAGPAGSFSVAFVVDIGVRLTLLVRSSGHNAGKRHRFCGAPKSGTATFVNLELPFLLFQARMLK